jgi:type IV pilus assembly protein PilY1
MMFRKIPIVLFSAGAILLSSGGPVRSDDTELYLNPTSLTEADAPLVMFSIDYRPNLGSVKCQRGDGKCDFLVDAGFMPEKELGDSYDFFDLIRGAFGYVLDEVSGVRLGLMFNHDHINNCEGSSQPGCSNGGYIGMAFNLLDPLNTIDAEGNIIEPRKSCAPFQGDGLETNEQRNYGACPIEDTRRKALNILWDIPVSTGDRTHSYQGKELFFEFFRYLRGFDVYNGHTGFTSYDGNDGYDSNGDGIPDLLPDPLPADAPNPNLAADPANADANNWNLDADPLHVDYSNWDPSNWPESRKARYAWDPDAEIPAGGTYIDPFAGGECTDVYTVNMMFQVSNQEDDSDPEIKKSESDQGMGINKRNPTFVDVIAELRNVDQSGIPGDQGVKSYFLLADPFVKNRTGGQYAVAGGTGAPLLLSDKPDELIANLRDIFKQILSVSTTFVAASIPVNSFNRAEVLENVYLALFQPHPDADPYWYGNVKKLRLAGINTGDTVRLEDAEGRAAIAADGRIRFDALTFWTDPTMYDVLESDADLGEVPGKDGRSVNRGGAGHKQKGFSGGSPGAANSEDGARRIFYDATKQELADLDATDPDVLTAVEADFGAAGDVETTKLIRWLRGQDIYDEDSDFGGIENPELGILDPALDDPALTEGRRWYMASALHSRPIPINYGAREGYSKNNPLIAVAVGTNDGMMRLIRNTPTDHAPGEPETNASYGEELWAFAPRATMGITRFLAKQAIYPDTPQPPYGVDGSPVVFSGDSNGNGTIDEGESVWLFFGLRRGGEAYYALDISDPENPSLMWRIQHGDAGFEDLGYTFSTPIVGQVNYGGATKPVLLFGGGYDIDKYDDFSKPAADEEVKGNAVFVVDAETGGLIHTFTHPDLTDSVASPLAAVDLARGDGVIDRAVVGDMGGNVWRLDFPPGAAGPEDWRIHRLASLGRRDAAACSIDDPQCGQDRRFFHAPDLVPFRDESGNYDAVIIGSGNRDKPTNSAIDNYMFMIKDRDTTPLLSDSTPQTEDVAIGELADITSCTEATTCAQDGLVNGWKLELEAAGEKSLASPITLSGIVFFTTFLPPGTAGGGDGDEENKCVPPEGEGRLYAVGLAEGNALVNRDKPIDDQESPGDPDDRWEKLASAGIPAEVVALPPKFILRPDLTVQEYPGRQRWRTFWYKEEEPGQ